MYDVLSAIIPSAQNKPTGGPNQNQKKKRKKKKRKKAELYPIEKASNGQETHGNC